MYKKVRSNMEAVSKAAARSSNCPTFCRASVPYREQDSEIIRQAET